MIKSMFGVLLMLLSCVGCSLVSAPFTKKPSSGLTDKALFASASTSPPATCEQMEAYISVLSELTDLRPSNVEDWIGNRLQEEIKRIELYPANDKNHVLATVGTGRLGITFDDTLFHSIQIPIQTSGTEIIECLGNPTYYHAYLQPNAFSSGYMDIVFLYYETVHLGFTSYEYDPSSNSGETIPFTTLTYWQPDNPEKNIFENVHFGAGLWDSSQWQEQVVRPWQGWDSIILLTSEDIVAGPRIDVAATKTATAPLLRTIPAFPLAQSADSAACQRVLDPHLISLNHGQTSISEVKTLLFVLDSNRESQAEISVDEAREVIEWTLDTPESFAFYELFFEDDRFQYAYVDWLRSQSTIDDYITCFGAPSHYQISHTSDRFGPSSHLYLYFPQQGIITTSTFYDPENVVLGGALSINAVVFNRPADDHVSLTTSVIRTASARHVQPWQGFEQLIVNPP